MVFLEGYGKEHDNKVYFLDEYFGYLAKALTKKRKW
jgi:hypothetical protein